MKKQRKIKDMRLGKKPTAKKKRAVPFPLNLFMNSLKKFSSVI